MNEALNLLLRSRESGIGWYGVAAAAVVLLIRGFRSESVQSVLPVVAQWSRLKRWVQLLLVFCAALLASWVTALITGMAPAAALLFSIPTALTAIGGHKATKAAGHAMTRDSIRMDIGYKPGKIRAAVSPILPMDKKAMARAADLDKVAKERYRKAKGK